MKFQTIIGNSLLVVFTFRFLLPQPVQAQLLLNEISPTSSDDWVEIINTGTQSANLAEYRLRDSTTNKKDLQGNIDGGGLKVIDFSNRLNNSGDSIMLVKISGENEEEVDKLSYGDGGMICLPQTGQTIGRQENRNWVLFSSATKEEQNNSPVANCTQPTATPENSPKTSPTAHASPTKNPTPVPTALQVPKISPKNSSPTVKSETSPFESPQVLSVFSQSASPSADIVITKSKGVNFLGLIMMTLGIGFSGLGGWFFYHKQSKTLV